MVRFSRPTHPTSFCADSRASEYEWDREEKRTPAPRNTLEPDPSAVRLDDPPGNRQPESRASLVRRPPCMPVAVEHARLILQWNSRTGLAHRNDHLLAARLGAHGDPTAIGCELQRIAEQIAEHLDDPRAVRHNGREIRGDFAHELNLSTRRLDLEHP